LIIFWQKNIGTKAARKMLMKLTIGLCFSFGTAPSGKNQSSYLAVAPFSILLWQRISNARVILLVAYKR